MTDDDEANSPMMEPMVRRVGYLLDMYVYIKEVTALPKLEKNVPPSNV